AGSGTPPGRRAGHTVMGSTASIEAAVAAAERNGLRLHLRVRLTILATIAVWLFVNYVPARALPGLLAVAPFAALAVIQYELGRRYRRPILWAGVRQWRRSHAPGRGPLDTAHASGGMAATAGCLRAPGHARKVHRGCRDGDVWNADPGVPTMPAVPCDALGSYSARRGAGASSEWRGGPRRCRLASASTTVKRSWEVSVMVNGWTMRSSATR